MSRGLEAYPRGSPYWVTEASRHRKKDNDQDHHHEPANEHHENDLLGQAALPGRTSGGDAPRTGCGRAGWCRTGRCRTSIWLLTMATRLGHDTILAPGATSPRTSESEPCHLRPVALASGRRRRCHKPGPGGA